MYIDLITKLHILQAAGSGFEISTQDAKVEQHKMATLATMADLLYEAVNTGDVDAVMDLLKKGLCHLITKYV